MPAKSEPPRASKEEQQQYDTSHRGDTAGSGGPAGATGARDKGVVAGIGGTGDSSGAGATRHIADVIGELSGIENTGTQPEAISRGSQRRRPYLTPTMSRLRQGTHPAVKAAGGHHPDLSPRGKECSTGRLERWHNVCRE